MASALRLILFVSLGLMLIIPPVSGEDAPLLLLAQADEGDAPPSEGSSGDQWFSDGKKLGQWWKNSAFEYEPMPREILYHLRASYNFSKMTGNTDAETKSISGLFILRKDVFTNIFNLKIEDNETSQGDSTVKTKDKNWRELLKIDLAESLYTVAGVKWMHSESRYIDSQYTYFAGVGTDYEFDPMELEVFCAFAREELEYIGSGETKKNNALYVDQSLTWPIMETLSFEESFEITQSIDHSKDYDWNLNLTLWFQIFEPLSLNTTYSISYDNQPYEDVKDTDTSLSAGLTLTF